MRYFSTLFITVLWIFTSGLCSGQTSVMDLKNQGHQAYQEGRYYQAVTELERFNKLRPGNLDVLTELGISYFHTNQLQEALDKMLLVIKNDNRLNELLYFYTARTYHFLGRYDIAAEYYKKYILEGTRDSLKEESKAQLLRCEYAPKIALYKQKLYADNMGSNINTVQDEFNPVVSPSSSLKLYFSAETIPLEKNSLISGIRYQSDIYGTFLGKGIWQERTFMNKNLNTPQNEELYGLSADGYIAYFYRGSDEVFGRLFADTFGLENKTKESITDWPFNPAYGDTDLHFINDSTLVYAAIKKDGYGGYDLYLTQKKNGKWTSPRNLGPTVNTAYNERSPYISRDLLTIVFSSDRPHSLGGYDFFMGKWNTETRRYKEIENAGMPLNSAGNDIYFTMNLDRRTCYFSSDRKTGIGGYDLYIGYFKDPLSKTQVPFPMVEDHLVQGPDENAIDALKPKDITIESILYSDGPILTSRNKDNINEIADVLKAYPETTLRIQVFSNSSLKKDLELYFGIKTGEQVAKYLVNQGIEDKRIQITACGSSYPLATSRYIGGGHIPDRVNSRVDFYIGNSGQYPLGVTYELPEVPKDADQTAFKIFSDYTEGLSYRIQIAAVTQKYSSPILEEEKNPLIHKIAGYAFYKYTLGLFKSYMNALKYKNHLQEKGFKDAFIVPYINGMHYTTSELKSYVEQYPDLKLYLKAIGN